MISILVSEENSIDADILLAEVKDAVAKQWDEDVEIRSIYKQNELDAYTVSNNIRKKWKQILGGSL